MVGGGTDRGKETSLPPTSLSLPGEPRGVRRTGIPPPRQADPPTADQDAPGARGFPATPGESRYGGRVRQRRGRTGPGATGHPSRTGGWGTTARPPLPSPPHSALQPAGNRGAVPAPPPQGRLIGASSNAVAQLLVPGLEPPSSVGFWHATRNRLYTWAANPPDFGAALCPLCGLAFADMPWHEALECVPQLISLQLQTWAAWRVSASAGYVPSPGASLAVYEGTVLVSGVHSTFALAVQQRPTALPQAVLARLQWTVYTVRGLTAQAPLSATPFQHHNRVLSVMAATALAAPQPSDVVQASLHDAIAGQPLAWMPTATVLPAVRILGLSSPLRPWVSIVLACLLRATRWNAIFLPGPPVVPLAPRAHHGEDGVVVVTCSADLALPDIKVLLARAASAHRLAVLASTPAPHALFLALSLLVTLHSAMSPRAPMCRASGSDRQGDPLGSAASPRHSWTLGN